MLRRMGAVVGLAGSAGGLIGSLWYLVIPTPDANIGAGALVVLGLIMGVVGAAITCTHFALGWVTSTAQTDVAGKLRRRVR